VPSPRDSVPSVWSLPRVYVPLAISGQALGYYLPPLRGSLFSGFGRSKRQDLIWWNKFLPAQHQINPRKK
jgi:hypothetical protein